jgi:cytochrome P450
MHRGRYIGHVTKQFQDEYGDTFQLWLGLLHMNFVCNPEDVQHVFTHRHIYEQGDLHVNQHRLVFNDALICNIGMYICNDYFRNLFVLFIQFFTIGPKYKRHAGIVLPLFRRGKILNNYDLIIDCTDKLLDQWRSTTDNDPNHIHLNIIDQCQNLSLAIFGFIAFGYDLQTLEESNINKANKLTQALNDFLEIFIHTTRLPNIISELYLKLNFRYQRTRLIIEQFLNQIMEQEQRKTAEQIAEQKRTSLIASLVTSLQQDEKAEAAKPEQEKKGK